jgi:Hint domain
MQRGNDERASLPGGNFTTGTQIAVAAPDLTPTSRAVDELQPGDLVLTQSGAAHPIRAIARRRIDIASHPTPARVTPIRLRAGALGHQTPSQDLLLPQEALLSIPSDSTSVLTPIGALVNGISILREPAAGIVTWHSIELDEHDILRAEGAPIGSLRGLRTSEPSRTPPRAPLCQPFMPPGAAMLTLRTQLHKRATSPEFMALITGTQPELWIANDPAHPLRLFADGKEVAADEHSSDTQFHFTLPANTGPVRLHATPLDSPSPKDLRRLAACRT